MHIIKHCLSTKYCTQLDLRAEYDASACNVLYVIMFMYMFHWHVLMCNYVYDIYVYMYIM